MSSQSIFGVERTNDTLFITLQKSLDGFDEVEMLDETDRLRPLIDDGKVRAVVVDFEQLSYFNSMMLEALLRLWRQVSAAGGQMALCKVSQVGREILQVSKFDSLWPICESRKEACGVLAGRARS